MDPYDMGGVPAVMPTNDWWTGAEALGSQALDAVAKVAVARAAPSGVVSSNPQNPPPGGAFRQSQVIAGAPLPGAFAQMPSWVWIALAVLAAGVVFALKKK